MAHDRTLLEDRMDSCPSRYAEHVDRWMRGHEVLILPAEFIARELAAGLVEQYMAEQGFIAA